MSPSQWLQSGDEFPSDGLELTVTYQTGDQSSSNHIPYLNPVLAPVLGADLFAGSLNFYANSSVPFPEPATFPIDGADWLFVPVVMKEAAVGVAARKANSGDIEFIEVFAREKLAPRLGLIPGSELIIRLLPGKHLGLVA